MINLRKHSDPIVAERDARYYEFVIFNAAGDIARYAAISRTGDAASFDLLIGAKTTAIEQAATMSRDIFAYHGVRLKIDGVVIDDDIRTRARTNLG